MKTHKNGLGITIVTPSYNQGHFLRRTIESIIVQNYSGLEYFIVDGGSMDDSVNIIKEYEEKIDWWVSEKDKGQSDAINKGFQRATGSLCCWVNSDDVLFPGALKKVENIFYANPTVDIITGNAVYINGNDFIIRCVRAPKQNWYFYGKGVCCFTGPAVFFKKKLLEKVGGLDINLHYAMDEEIWHRFRLVGAKVYHINEYLGGFRVHSSSKTGPNMQKRKRYFEHPETTLIRSKYIPKATKSTKRAFRMIYKMWQVANLNYLKAWLDLWKFKGKTWQKIF